MADEPDQKTIVVLGETGVGKTCFTDMFLTGRPFHQYNPTNPWKLRKLVQVGETALEMTLDDINSTMYREPTELLISYFTKVFREADGLVLMYDVTSKASFDYVTSNGYFDFLSGRRREMDNGIPYPCRSQRFGGILVGNKSDTPAEEKEVRTELAQQWADSQGFKFHELTTTEIDSIMAAMVDLGRSIIHAERRDVEDMEIRSVSTSSSKSKRGPAFVTSIRKAFRSSTA